MVGEVQWTLLCRGSVAGVFPCSRIGEGKLGSRSAPGRSCQNAIMARTFPTLASRREVLEGPSTCIFAQRRRHRLGAAPRGTAKYYYWDDDEEEEAEMEGYNDDDVAFCFNVPKSSGEATWVRLLAGNEEQDDIQVLWNFIWPLTRAASSSDLDKLPVLVRVTATPTYAVTRSPRNLAVGAWRSYGVCGGIAFRPQKEQESVTGEGLTGRLDLTGVRSGGWDHSCALVFDDRFCGG